MTIDTLDGLVAALRDSGLLDEEQQARVPALALRFPDPSALTRELERLGWLTPYQAEELLAGRGGELVLGQYVILSLLGQGGMGKVFKARHRLMKRVVALKVIRPALLADPRAVQRFRREIEAVSRLSHPNIVAAFDANQVGNTHFLVMEYVEGTDLARLVKEHGPLPTGLACDCIRQAALGLKHAHEQGMVHRDVKPANLLLSRSGAPGAPPVVKVLDMGLARLHAEEGDGLTHTGAVMGTPDYIAPEQASNSHLVDIRADLYSLGCTLYFLLAGEPPFPGGTAMEKLFKHQYVAPRPVEVRRPELPPAVAAIVARLLAKRPEERYQTPAELAEALAPLSVVNPDDEATTIYLPKPPPATEAGPGTIRASGPAGETMHPEGGATRLEGAAPIGSVRTPGDWSAAPVPYVEPASPAGAVPAVHPGLEVPPAPAPPRRRVPVLLAGFLMLVGAAVVVAAVALPPWSALWKKPVPSEAEGDSGRTFATRPQENGSERDNTKTTAPGPRDSSKVDTSKEKPKATERQPGKPTVEPPPPPLLPQGVVAEVKDGAAKLAAFAGLTNAVAIVTDQYLSWYDLTFNKLGEGEPGRCQIGEVNFTRWTYGLAVTLDGTRVFYGDKIEPDGLEPAVNALRMWEPNPVYRTTPKRDSVPTMLDVTCMALSRDSKRAVTGTGLVPGDKATSPNPEVLVWDLTDPKRPKAQKERFTGHKKNKLLSVALSDDGRRAVSFAELDTVRWWDVESAKEMGSVIPDNVRTVTSVAISPDGSLIFYADDNHSLHKVSFTKSSEDFTFKGRDPGPITAIAVAANGSQVLAGNDYGGMQLWSVDGELLHTWSDAHGKGPDGKKTVRAVALSPDGNYAYSVGADNRICRWYTPAGERLAPPK